MGINYHTCGHSGSVMTDVNFSCCPAYDSCRQLIAYVTIQGGKTMPAQLFGISKKNCSSTMFLKIKQMSI